MTGIYVTTSSELRRELDSLATDPRVHSALILQADEGHPSTEVMNDALRAFTKPIIGGIFPELIVKGVRVKTGTLLLPLATTLQTAVIDASEDAPDFAEQLKNHFSDKLSAGVSVFVFDDAMAPLKNQFIHSLFNYFGTTVKYVGGGAGSLSYDRFPCVYHNSGAHHDSIVLGLSGLEIALGVAHGWQPISEPMKITEAQGRTIISINWEPAFQVYRRFVEGHSSRAFADENFFDIAKSYPVGVIKLESEMIIRDPFMHDNDTLRIVNEIRTGEYISIMHGNPESLLAGAEAARDQASNQVRAEAKTQDFCVDCITRVLYMGEAFEKEINLIQGTAELNGILSLGEIANSGDTYLEIYNKTVVLAKWETTAS